MTPEEIKDIDYIVMEVFYKDGESRMVQLNMRSSIKRAIKENPAIERLVSGEQV